MYHVSRGRADESAQSGRPGPAGAPALPTTPRPTLPAGTAAATLTASSILQVRVAEAVTLLEKEKGVGGAEQTLDIDGTVTVAG